MPDHDTAAGSSTPGADLPALAGEDHQCAPCGLSYPEITIERALDFLTELPAATRAAVLALPPAAHRQRPSPPVWSVTEYLCHLRDVYATYTIRLHRTCTEDRPALEPMFADLRAARFAYNTRDVDVVLDELAATVHGFCQGIRETAPADWDRVATRRPDERRSARWLVRQAMHEGAHHLRDIDAVGRGHAP